MIAGNKYSRLFTRKKRKHIVGLVRKPFIDWYAEQMARIIG